MWTAAQITEPVTELDTYLENMQLAHVEATGGPNETAGVAVGIHA